MHMVVEKKLGIYAATSYVCGRIQAHPWELAAAQLLSVREPQPAAELFT
jgi:hypothetical protein